MYSCCRQRETTQKIILPRSICWTLQLISRMEQLVKATVQDIDSYSAGVLLLPTAYKAGEDEQVCKRKPQRSYYNGSFVIHVWWKKMD